MSKLQEAVMRTEVFVHYDDDACRRQGAVAMAKARVELRCGLIQKCAELAERIVVLEQRKGHGRAA